MNKKIKNELDIIKNSVLQTVPETKAIYLFGSFANGTPNENSDIDIYVVVPDNSNDLTEIYSDILLDLWKKKTRPLDLLIGRANVFNKRKEGPTLERIIATDGVQLYG